VYGKGWVREADVLVMFFRYGCPGSLMSGTRQMGKNVSFAVVDRLTHGVCKSPRRLQCVPLRSSVCPIVTTKRLLSVDTIRYDTRCQFNVRSKADTSQLNLPHGNNN